MTENTENRDFNGDNDKRYTNASVLDYYAYIAETGDASSSSSPSSKYSSGGTLNDVDKSNRQISVMERMDSSDYPHLNVYTSGGEQGPVKVGSYHGVDVDHGTSIGHIPSDILLKRRGSAISQMSTAALNDAHSIYSHSSRSSRSSDSTIDLPSPTDNCDPVSITRDMPLPNAFSSKATYNGASSTSDRVMRTAEAINALARAASGLQVWLRCVGGEGRPRSYSPPPLVFHSERYKREKSQQSIQSDAGETDVMENNDEINRQATQSPSNAPSIHSSNAQTSNSPYMSTPVVPYHQERPSIQDRQHSSASFATNSTFPLRPGSDINVAHDLTKAVAGDSPPDKIPEHLPYPGAAAMVKKTGSTSSAISSPRSTATVKASRAAGFFANLGRRTSAKSPPKKLQIGHPSPISKDADLPSSISSISPPLYTTTPGTTPPRSPNRSEEMVERDTPATGVSTSTASTTTSTPTTISGKDNKEVTVPARGSSHKTPRHVSAASTSHINLDGLERAPTGPRAKPSKSRNSSIFNLTHVLNPEPFPGLANLKPPSKYELRASTPAPVRQSSKKPAEEMSPAFKASLNRLENLLPQAAKSDLRNHLKKANGDEMRAVGTYIESQRL
ncbi:hypothetical protein E3P81_03329 [Wallemia ichthyophaga]|nr:hypothetical protein E3P91_03486 [Wallemia ichthyophaga]TIA82342.1 hypothetical protein E3P98_01527 [Wallemia ichthyophaga]TIA88810.1 hypothetical protein E3P97_03366 [Wallemia ichthyophaga]TIB05831.1 hypothetical protein E3P96_00885 [Wallemia ichthyophaga]TIB29508.1 hypothetical protein E3P85_03142 [Wallemia ichthyophaga]